MPASAKVDGQTRLSGIVASDQEEEFDGCDRTSGRLLLDLNHAPALWMGFLPAVAHRRGDDVMADEHSYDPLSGRLNNRRIVVRDGRVRSFRFSTRLFGYPELRDWLADAGFVEIAGFGPDGENLTHQSRRLIVRALR